jgi:hypothetical protein
LLLHRVNVCVTGSLQRLLALIEAFLSPSVCVSQSSLPHCYNPPTLCKLTFVCETEVMAVFRSISALSFSGVNIRRKLHLGKKSICAIIIW